MRLFDAEHTLVYATLLLSTGVAAKSLDCETVVASETRFNFKALGGPKAVSWIQSKPPSVENTTFTIDICKPLKKTGKKPREDCRMGTYICGIKSLWHYGEEVDGFANVIEIAGQYEHSTGYQLHPRWTRLKDSASHGDSDKEGVRLELNGPEYAGKKQETIIEFLCPTPKSDSEDGTLRRRKIMATADDGDKEEDGDDDKKKQEEWEKQRETPDGEGGTVKFLSYKDFEEDKKSVLRLQWTTKYACEDAASVGRGDESPGKGGMGFFGWFFTLLFLGIAAYFIFFSWLNYNRYGARGWDLIPHSDGLRDLPYILGDWFRKVVSTIQGGGSRGGYSAV